MEGITCGQFTFYNDFDSANLAKVEYVPPNESIVVKNLTTKTVAQELVDAEFNLWTKPDCYGTEFENGNRTWFYFGVKAPESSLFVRFNIVDLNRQGKMYGQGMAPVFRVLPGKTKWERISEKPVFGLVNDVFTLTFKFRTPENRDSVMYFAFTYPFTFGELEKMLVNIDAKYLHIKPICDDDIYYVKETVCYSIERRPIELITISSYHGITSERECKLKGLFLDNVPRPFKFVGKKIIFVSARVHPGETPSSFVFNGLLNLLLSRDDLTAQILRKMYVFKMIPFLNPDGVAKGHYRTDSKGVNLNRVYLNPSITDHPSVYAARALIRYYHYGVEKEDVIPKCDTCKHNDEIITEIQRAENISSKVSQITLEEGDHEPSTAWCTKWHNFCRNCGKCLQQSKSKEEIQFEKVAVGAHGDVNSNESGLFMYLDLHGHASKKGIFMYGNHFDDVERNVECMLLPKLMSLNNHHFHFNACNFTERNMYLRDKRDGMSRAGSGRVAVLSITGIIKSYTLECNYNTGRLTNVLPPSVRESNGKPQSLPVPPKYTPQLYEEVGKSLGSSILDLTGNNPFTRLANSEFHTLNGLRDWLRNMATSSSDVGNENRPKMKQKSAIVGLHSQGKAPRNIKPHHPTVVTSKPACKRAKVMIPLDRKENLAQPSSSKSSNLRLNKCMKTKSRKDLTTLKTKNITTADKMKSLGKGVKKNGPPNAPTAVQKLPQQSLKDKPSSKDSEGGIHLREICFIKSNERKAVIAKYDSAEFDDSLVVSWDKSAKKPQIYTQKTRINSAPAYLLDKNPSEPGTSKDTAGGASSGGAFRVHNFAKTIPIGKNKFKRHNLRRLASAADILAKVDKKPKKKLKSKCDKRGFYNPTPSTAKD